MAKIRKKDIALVRTVFLILLSLVSFMAGFSVSNRRYTPKQNPMVPRIRSVPDRFFVVPQNQAAMFYSDE